MYPNGATASVWDVWQRKKRPWINQFQYTRVQPQVNPFKLIGEMQETTRLAAAAIGLTFYSHGLSLQRAADTTTVHCDTCKRGDGCYITT